MRVLVCGGRRYNDQRKVFRVLDDIHETTPIKVIIEGGARGADFLGLRWAKTNEVQVKEFQADWGKFGRSAGHVRNNQMLKYGKPDLVVAFPGGKGTQNMVDISRKAGVNVVEISDNE